MQYALRKLRNGLGILLFFAGTVVLATSLAAPELGVGRSVGDTITRFTNLFDRTITIGRFGVPLKDSEKAIALNAAGAELQLLQHAAAAPPLNHLLPSVNSCVEVQDQDTAGVLLVCAPSVATQAFAADASMPPEAGIPYIEMIRAQQQRLSVDADVQASWIPESEELKQHRETLLADGYAVGTGIITAQFGERGVMGTILEWSGGAEWFGYLWVGGDTYLVWGWAPDRAALDELLTR